MSAFSTPISKTTEGEAKVVGPKEQLRTSKTLQLPCVHCAEPTTCNLGQDPTHVFCCAGCRGAHQLIHAWGLESFYALRDQTRLTGQACPAQERDGYEQFDSVDFLGSNTLQQNSDGTCTAELAIHGLHCGACAWLIETAVGHEQGLLAARVQMSQHSIRLVFDPAQTRLSKIAKFLDRLGYSLSPFDSSRDAIVRQESRRQLIQIAVAGFLATNAMWIAIALYAGEASGVAFEHRYFLSIIGTLLGLASVVVPGRTFLVGAFAAFKHRVPHMDLPVALGICVGAAVGTINAVRGAGHLYFDSVSGLVFLLLIGRWIQFRQQQRAMNAIDLMLRITPRHATLIRGDGKTSLVLVETLAPNDLIRVAAGECIAADGIIQQGETQIDRSLLNGESKPVRANVGDAVLAGTNNIVSSIDVLVNAVGRNSRIGHVMQAVEHAATTRTPVVQLADRIGGYFVVIVTLLAAATFALWLGSGVGVAAANATALLIVACPCALALATPLAIAVGLGRAAKRSIFIRDGNAFQLLSQPGTIWLDKTGTLTLGKQSVTSLVGSLEGLHLAAQLEANFNHPVATAIVRAADLKLDRTSGVSVEAVKPEVSFAEAQNGGVIGTLIDAGRSPRVSVGNLCFTQSLGAQIDASFFPTLASIVDSGATPILIAVDGSVVTVIGLSDQLREGAAEFVAGLKQSGWSVGILSGDHPAIVERIGTQLRIEQANCFGGLSPEDKLAKVRQTHGSGRVVVMVGDGVNDAAALAAADVGIALRGGAEVSLQAAPIFIADGKLSHISSLLLGAKRTTRLIWATFAISITYNLSAIALAIAGWITPLIAAILMPISSVTILAIILSTKTFAKDHQ